MTIRTVSDAWIDKWPAHPTIIVQHGDREDNEDDADVDVEMEPTIRIQRAQLTSCPNPPTLLSDWLKPTWQSVDAKVEVLESRNFVTFESTLGSSLIIENLRTSDHQPDVVLD